MSGELIFLDTETTGLDEHSHRVWELAALRRAADGTLTELHRFLRVSIKDASPEALRISRFDERYDAASAVLEADALAALCEFAAGGCLMLLNPWFDARFVSAMFGRANAARERRQPLSPTWHYSPVDVKSFAAGALRLPPPWRSDDIAQALGVRHEDFARHGALADCYYAAALYDAALTR